MKVFINVITSLLISISSTVILFRLIPENLTRPNHDMILMLIGSLLGLACYGFLEKKLNDKKVNS